MLDTGTRAPWIATVKTITSRQHPFVSRCRAAARGRPTDAGEILLDGIHLLEDAVEAHVVIETAAFTTAAAQSSEGGLLAARLDAGGTHVLTVSDAVMEALSPVRTPTGVVAIGRHASCPLGHVFAPPPALVVGIAGVQDPGNVGAIIRVAEAAGATGVVVTDGSANPFGWKALRGAMGSTFRIPVAAGIAVTLLLDTARSHGTRRFATVPAGGVELSACDLVSASLVLVGSEGHGLDAGTVQAADERLHISMATRVESLNVAVAAGVILFEARRQRTAHTRACAR
jgi:TrmH family RNA methyltransferase